MQKKFATSWVEVDASKIIKDDDEVLAVPAILAREGTLKYPEGMAFRPGDELDKSTFTFDGAFVVSGKHPDELILSKLDDISGRTHNSKFVAAKGKEAAKVVGEIHFWKKRNTPGFIDAVRTGKRKGVSMGFLYELDETPGKFKGSTYDFVQRNILVNHIAGGVTNPRDPQCNIQVDAADFLTGHLLHPTVKLFRPEDFETSKKMQEAVADFLDGVFSGKETLQIQVGLEYSKADPETAWTYKEADYNPEQLSHACAVVVVDGEIHSSGYKGEELTKGACKLPHHLPGDGKSHGGKLVWRGVGAAGAALMGARGGVKLSDDAKAKARSHLAAHYREFDKTPPWESDAAAAGDPEENEKEIRIPVLDCTITATIQISEEQGIKALYCGEEKKIATYIFDKTKDWTMEKAKEWVAEHKTDEDGSLTAEGIKTRIGALAARRNEIINKMYPQTSLAETERRKLEGELAVIEAEINALTEILTAKLKGDEGEAEPPGEPVEPETKELLEKAERTVKTTKKLLESS